MILLNVYAVFPEIQTNRLEHPLGGYSARGFKLSDSLQP